MEQVGAARLVQIAGGDKRNAIPRECKATITVSRQTLVLIAVAASACENGY